MKVCLVRCPSPFLIEDKVFPPLGLMAVGTGLKLRGHEVRIHDGPLGEIPMVGYTHYGFGPTTPEYPAAKSAIRKIWLHNRNATCILGGPHATLNYRDCRHDGWDGILVGDGEVEAEKVFSFFGRGHIVTAQERPLDEYPIPDRSLLDLSQYHYKLEGIPATTLTTSKGCPHHCDFCCKNHGKVRLRSAKKVIDEIVYLHDGFGYKALAFPEDIFIVDRKRTEVVCQTLKMFGITWRCLVRADIIVRRGQEFIRMMKDSGCAGVGMGVESGSDTILANVHKGETADTMRKAIAMLKAEGLKVKGFFIIGLPGESPETLAETEKFLDKVELDDIDAKIFQPYPGSPIHDHREQYDIRWDNIPLENSFYKGRPGEYFGSLSTSALTTAQIVEAWKRIETKYKKWETASA